VISGVLPNASWLVTDRTAGDSQGAFAFNNLALHVGDEVQAVTANRTALARQLHAPIVFATAAHSNQVGYVDALTDDVPGVDALISDQAGLAVAAQSADCAMIGIAAGRWVAAVHCGWRGLVAGVIPATLTALTDRGADLSNAYAHVGPVICPQCYPVGEDTSAAVADVCPTAVPAPGRIDLRAGVLAQLNGIETTHDPRCTFEDPDLYSYRRDGVTGRQALAIVRMS